MPERFNPIPLNQLLQIILNEYGSNKSIFGIPEELFYIPDLNSPFNSDIFLHKLDSPLGVAAGPHSQLTQNIVGAWLTGARYIELKTVQTLDTIEVSKPCIDMQDAGYNCEWSQELTIKESFNEYLNAWIIIHILNHKFGWGDETGTVFNMSAGYNMEGILNDNMQWYFDKISSCSTEIATKKGEIRSIYPEIDNIVIQTSISDNITISTMHGCPADEIEAIAAYFLEKRKLHTLVKLNPTLLGPEEVRNILNGKLGFKTIVPDAAFAHDLKYPDAVLMITSLLEKACKNNRIFGLKLTNTLETVNTRNIFDLKQEMMYMSGRPLHPLAVSLANKLRRDFNCELPISFSAGADAFNIPELISCGFNTITVCSDLLKPGGYMRMKQYYDVLHERFNVANAGNIDEFILKNSGAGSVNEAAKKNLSDYASIVSDSKRYKRNYIKEPDIKSARNLTSFDCISAPCVDNCPTGQNIPEYMYLTSQGMPQKACDVILATNPFPSVTGMVCDHLCQDRCTRINYDESLLIREVKSYVADNAGAEHEPLTKNGGKIAVVGAGPAGLTCAFYLAKAGFEVDVFESRSEAGGMVRFAIPGFRLTEEAIGKDLQRIKDTGVNIHYNTPVGKQKYNSLKKDFDYVFIGAGAQLSSELNIEGIHSQGVLDALDFLFAVREKKDTGIGKNVIIVGGGNSAMDAARTAFRLVGNDGKVTIVYRRTVKEMPADQGEIKAVLEEGIGIIELAAPEKIITENGRVSGIILCRMELSGIDFKGRPLPVRIEGSEFSLDCDTIIPAIGQKPDLRFASEDTDEVQSSFYATKSKKTFIGGDALRGASTAINAIADGRKAAGEIMKASGISFNFKSLPASRKHTLKDLMIKRAVRAFAPLIKELPPYERKNFRLVSERPSKDVILKEAGRCLYCDEICNICTTVCPNFANYSYTSIPVNFMLKKVVVDNEGKAKIVDDIYFSLRQEHQILHIANFCNNCGNCATFCPTSGAPYKQKPSFFLTRPSFDAAKEGYYVDIMEGKRTLIHKTSEGITFLSETGGHYLYETENILSIHKTDDFSLVEITIREKNSREIKFEDATRMSILLNGSKKLVFS